MATGPGIGQKVKGATDEVEAELKRLVNYINDEVVPQVRRNSSTALRAAAEQLGRLAENLEKGSAGSNKH